MSLEDPLEPFRVAGKGEWTPATAETRVGELLLRSWTRGGSFVALTARKVVVAQNGELLAIPRGQVASIGVARVSNIKRMRWGLGLYGASFLLLVLQLILLAVPAALAGGVLVVQGFLAKALLLQLRDARIPPLVVPQRRWRAIGKAIEDMR